MTDIAAANVTNVTAYEFELPTVRGELRKSGSESMRLVVGKLSIATNYDYDTTVQIPLDNLFDSTTASYIELVASTCRTIYLGRLAGGTFQNSLVADWPNKKIKVLALPATPAENEDLDEVADGTALGSGTMTIEFAVVGKVVRTA